MARALVPLARLSVEDVQSLMTAVLLEYNYAVVSNDVSMGLACILD